jgi:arylsulfatase A-like enzyme
VAAGLYDFVHALARAGTFLPDGKWKLALFLCALYGAAASLAVIAGGLFLGAIIWSSDGARLWRAAFAGEEHRGGRWLAYGLAGGAGLVALGFAVEAIARDALRIYHHRLLIAALVGSAAAGLFVLIGAAVLVVASVLSWPLRVGPSVRIKFTAPAGLEAAGWTVGLYLGSAAVTGLLFALEQRARMPLALQALNTGLWAPPILLACIVVAHFVTRKLPLRDRALATPRGALVIVVTALAIPPLLILVFQWSLVRQLDLRPWAALAVAFAGLIFGLWLDAGERFRRQRLWLRTLVTVATPALLLLCALGAGRLDRVRKAAVSFTGATGPLVGALQRITDLDHDGYSSILGGGDCNDFDREVHPGTTDWPDDGIDQDCNGHQATLQAAARTPFAPLPPSLKPAQHVVLITIDALRADHVGAYGYARPTTPRLDALAAQSTRFGDAWAHAPSTRYSIPAILTGRYPSTIATGMQHWPPNVLPENRLFAEILKDRGYHTAAFLSYYYFERAWGLDQGFDEYDYHLQTLHSGAGVDPSRTSGSSARQLADEVVDWIGRHRNEKFFLWTHFYDTHFMFDRHPDLPQSNFGNNEIDLYDGEIRFTDFHIGRVLDALSAAGLWDDTLVVVTSDHGDGFGEHGIPPNRRHGYHLYANETRVPLVMRIPGIAPGVVRSPVGHVDILPTVLNAIGAPDEAGLLGDSRLGLVTGSAPDDASSVVFQEVTYEGPSSRYNGTQKRALVTRDWHLIENVVPDSTRELYRRSDDALEEHDRAGLGESAESSLRDRLAAWMDTIALPPDFARRSAGNVATRPFAPRAALGDRLGDWLTIDGVDAPVEVAAQAPFEVVLYLHADAAIPAGWHLFTHVVGPGGRMINADHEPVEGTVPLSRLRTGTWVRDRVRVQLPAGWPPGPVTVRVGLWRGAERAPASGPHAAADRAVDVARVAVHP